MDIKAIVSKILEIIEYVQNKGSNFDTMPPEDIVRAFVMLAAYKATLGQELAKIQFEQNILEAKKKHLWTVSFIEFKQDKKTTDIAARTQADLEVQELEQEIVDLRYPLEVVKNLRVDTDAVISTLQSALNQRKQEAREATMQNYRPSN
jgi:hypothetical protein